MRQRARNICNQQLPFLTRWYHPELTLVIQCSLIAPSNRHLLLSAPLVSPLGIALEKFLSLFPTVKWDICSYCNRELGKNKQKKTPNKNNNKWTITKIGQQCHNMFPACSSSHHVAVIVFYWETLNMQVLHSLPSARQQSPDVWGFSRVYVVSGLRRPPTLLLPLFGGHRWLITCPAW